MIKHIDNETRDKYIDASCIVCIRSTRRLRENEFELMMNVFDEFCEHAFIDERDTLYDIVRVSMNILNDFIDDMNAIDNTLFEIVHYVVDEND